MEEDKPIIYLLCFEGNPDVENSAPGLRPIRAFTDREEAEKSGKSLAKRNFPAYFIRMFIQYPTTYPRFQTSTTITPD